MHAALCSVDLDRELVSLLGELKRAGLVASGAPMQSRFDASLLLGEKYKNCTKLLN